MTQLITNFTCSVCGSSLDIRYEDDERNYRPPPNNGVPVGLGCVLQDVVVEPCETCLGNALDGVSLEN